MTKDGSTKEFKYGECPFIEGKEKDHEGCQNMCSSLQIIVCRQLHLCPALEEKESEND